MTDNSKFVIRWEIDNAAIALATGRAESRIFYQGGFKWTAEFERVGDNALFSLRCGVDYASSKKCEAEVDLRVKTAEGFTGRSMCHFVENCRQWHYVSCREWSFFTDPENHFDGKCIFEFRIRMTSSERDEQIAALQKLFSPNDMSNVILVVEDEKLHVSKELLAIHSPVFKALFFGNFTEQGKDEVEIKDVVYEEFLDFLQMIYLRNTLITDRTVLHILKLADRFQIESLLDLSEKHLIQCQEFDVLKKLGIADQYRLHSLRDFCLNSFTSASDLSTKLKSSREFSTFSADTKAALCERIIALT